MRVPAASPRRADRVNAEDVRRYVECTRPTWRERKREKRRRSESPLNIPINLTIGDWFISSFTHRFLRVRLLTPLQFKHHLQSLKLCTKLACNVLKTSVINGRRFTDLKFSTNFTRLKKGMKPRSRDRCARACIVRIITKVEVRNEGQYRHGSAENGNG